MSESLPALPDPETGRTLLDRRDPETGRTPLEVMIRIMVWWDDHAEALSAQLDTLIVKIDDPEAARAATALMRDLILARTKALECASAVAPYYHGRVHSIAPSLAPQQPQRKSLKDEIESFPVDPVAASRAYLRLIQGK